MFRIRPVFPLILLLIVGVSGCCLLRRLRPARRCNPGPPKPVKGSRADFRIRPGVLGWAVVHPVQTCCRRKGPPGYRIAVTGQGWRRFDANNRAGCRKLPAGRGKGCPTVNFSAFMGEVHRILRRVGLRTSGWGLYPCPAGQPLKGPDGRFRGISVRLDDWRLAEPAVRVLAERLGQWQLGETVSVRLMPNPVVCLL